MAIVELVPVVLHWTPAHRRLTSLRQLLRLLSCEFIYLLELFIALESTVFFIEM